MSAIAETPPLPSPDVATWSPAPHSIYRFTVEQYEALLDAGVLTRHDRCHLINGIVVVKLTRKPPHVIASEKTRDALMAAVPPHWRVMVEAPVRIPRYNEPEPDLAVARGSVEDYEGRHAEPSDLCLIVEVAESNLAEDRELLRVYGAVRVAAYWIVNLLERQVEVYSDPEPAGYGLRKVFQAGENVPLVIDGVEVALIPAANMLPRGTP